MKVFIILAPFIVVYTINKKFERELERRPKSIYLVIGLIFCTVNIFGTIIIRTLDVFMAEGVPHVYWFISYLALFVGSLFIYWFVTLLREYQTQESAYQKFTSILPMILTFFVFFVATFWAIHPEHDLLWAVARPTLVFGYLILSLCYLELASFFRKFGSKYWYFLIISSLVFLGYPLIHLYNSIMVALGYAESSPLYLRGIQSSFGFIAGVLALIPSIILLLEMQKPMPKIDKKVLENDYLTAMFEFLKNSTGIVGGATMTIYRSAVEGFNRRFNRDIVIDDTIHLSGLSEDEWPKFLKFVLNTYYQCIGPILFDCTKGIDILDDLTKKIEEKYE
jgi:hypothetical protein